MLPATLAQEIRKHICRLRNQAKEKALEAFFNDPENGLFKEP
ncbi:hypothetical protein [Vreelandella glaciei]|tara:strand:- start:7881 stop:8006 length:126 start_codon:yes stop_codon:yes gene_type:complete